MNDEDVKLQLLSELQLIQEDTKALHQVDLKTAVGALESWHNSGAHPSSESRMLDLKTAMESGRRAFNAVKEPTDMIKAAGLVIFAEYHIAALDSSHEEPDWVGGKRRAEQLLVQYIDKMEKQLRAAAADETRKLRVGWLFKEKRRAILRDFANLTSSVFRLHPAGSGGESRPLFRTLEEAVLHACDEDHSAIMPAAIIDHFNSEPRVRRVLRGHARDVICCSVFGNDTRMVSGSGDRTLKVWDLATGEDIRTLDGDTGWVSCCSAFNNGTRLVSGSEDLSLKVWDLATGEEIRTLKGHTESVYCCSVFNNGTRMVSGSRDRTLKVWDLTTGEEIRTLKGHTSDVMCCWVFNSGTRMVSGSWDRTLKVWDLATGEEIRTLEGHTRAVMCCSVFDNGTRLVSGSGDHTLKVWDLATGEEIRTLEGHTGWVNCCSVFNNGRVVSGSMDDTLKVWDLTTGEETRTLQGHTDSVSCCSIFNNGTRMVSGSWDRTLKVWDLPSASQGTQAQPEQHRERQDDPPGAPAPSG